MASDVDVARNQSAARLMLASGLIVVTSVPFCTKMFPTFTGGISYAEGAAFGVLLAELNS